MVRVMCFNHFMPQFINSMLECPRCSLVKKKIFRLVSRRMRSIAACITSCPKKLLKTGVFHLANKLSEQLAVAHIKAKGGNLPFFRQLLEITYLFLRYRLGPGYYLMARFWRREVPFKEKTKHWNAHRYLRYIHRINDPRYYKVSQNKLVEKGLLSILNIPTTRLLGLFHSRSGQSIDGRRLTNAEELECLLTSFSRNNLFFKPAEGDSGRDVFAVQWIRDRECAVLRDLSSGKILSIDLLVKRLESAVDGYVIEEIIEQHPLLSAFNPSSVNTLRVWVLNKEGDIQVAGAFLRIGRAGSLVDNTAVGGLACPIDLQTGAIVNALDLTLYRNEYNFHPDTGVELVTKCIPYWNDCKVLACNALRVLPGANFIGIDLAITKEGPLVVEYNVEPSYQGATHIDLPHEVIFGAGAL